MVKRRSQKKKEGGELEVIFSKLFKATKTLQDFQRYIYSSVKELGVDVFLEKLTKSLLRTAGKEKGLKETQERLWILSYDVVANNLLRVVTKIINDHPARQIKEKEEWKWLKRWLEEIHKHQSWPVLDHIPLYWIEKNL